MEPARLFIGNTDRSWFDYLRARPLLEEVNFWLPGERQGFQALQPGEPFLFKLKHPDSCIAGGGFFFRYSRYPISKAWEFFEELNGVSSEGELRRKVGRYRGDPGRSRGDFTIGCVVLQSPFFLEPRDWIALPLSWAPNLTRGRTYSIHEAEGDHLWQQVRSRLYGSIVSDSRVEDRLGEVYGAPRLFRPRIGQGSFRLAITDSYQRRCAMTGEKALPVLEAAHIRPVAEGGGHWLQNGLLLRSDLHRLFDRGYVTVTPDLKMHVSGQLRSEYGNGEIYYPLEGKTLWTPPSADAQPNRQFLEWHSDTRFRP